MKESFLTKLQLTIVPIVKRLFGIKNMTLLSRRIKHNFERIIFRKTYTASDIVGIMRDMGLKPGDTLVVHCAMNNFYNYRGTAQELIDAILEYIGSEGTLCMPAYPYDKNNEKVVFDVRTDKTAAGFLAETFRKNPGVKRSLNKLHSVCAKGKNADYIISEHHLSVTCFDEHSPYYKIAELGGKSFSLGLSKYYIGTIGHVCESLLFNELQFFKDKFSQPVTFRYIDWNGDEYQHTLYTKSKRPYIRHRNSKLVDTYFDKTKYGHFRLSNIWINMYDAEYTVNRLKELAMEGQTIYNNPKFYK